MLTNTLKIALFLSYGVSVEAFKKTVLSYKSEKMYSCTS